MPRPGAGSPDPAKFISPNHNFRRSHPKPNGGFWTSSECPEECSAWVRYASAWEPGDFPGEQVVYRLLPLPGARVAVVDRRRDMEKILALYPRRPFGVRSPELLLDWEAIARDYDALRLTARGEKETRYTGSPLWGWDCESTLWLRWAFRGQEKAGLLREYGGWRKNEAYQGTEEGQEGLLLRVQV